MNLTPLARKLILFVGLAVVVTAYFWVHRPFNIGPDTPLPPEFFRLTGALLDLFSAALLFTAAGGVGAWLVARLIGAESARLSRLERATLETGIGLGVLAVSGAVIGLLGLYRPEILWIALGVALLLPARHTLGWIGRWRGIAASVRVSTAWEALALAVCAFLLLLALVTALAPPTHWDSLTYHLLIPTRALRDGAILGYSDNFYLGFSQNVEMLYGYVMMMFDRDTAPALVHFGIGLLGLLGCVGLARRHAGQWSGWTAALLALSAFSLWALFGWAYIDLGTMLYGAIALIALSAWDGPRVRGWLIVMGLAAGFAAGVKYNAGALALVMGGYVLLAEPRRVLRNGTIMALAALAAFAVWAVKGAVLYGNPIYPFLFGGLEWDAGRTYAFTFPFNSFIGRGWWWHVPILPFAATVFGQDRVDSYGFTAGPWLLTSFAALPLVWRWLRPEERRLARIALLAIAVLWGFWAAAGISSGIGVQTRLMIMIVPAFAVAGALSFVGVWRMPKRPLDMRILVRAIFVITLAFTLIDVVIGTIRERAAEYLFGFVTFDEYLYANTGAYGNAMLNLPAGSTVRMMWEPRGYYCPETVTCRADMVFDHWLRPLLNGADAAAVFEAYRAAGDDYLLFFDAGYQTYLSFSRDRALDESFLTEVNRFMTPVWTDGLRYTLYGWRDE